MSNTKKQPGHARKTNQVTVKVRVIADGGMGLYPKGKILQMSKSTADACIANGAVEKAK